MATVDDDTPPDDDGPIPEDLRETAVDRLGERAAGNPVWAALRARLDDVLAPESDPVATDSHDHGRTLAGDLDVATRRARVAGVVTDVEDLRTFDRRDESAEGGPNDAGAVLAFDVSDPSGTVACKAWDGLAHTLADQLTAGEPVRLRGTVDEYRGDVEVTSSALQSIHPEDVAAGFGGPDWLVADREYLYDQLDLDPALDDTAASDGKYPPDWSRRCAAVIRHYDERCGRCRRPIDDDGLPQHVHHARHLSQGGSHALRNPVPLCEPCHAAIHPHITDEGGADWRAAPPLPHRNADPRVSVERVPVTDGEKHLFAKRRDVTRGHDRRGTNKNNVEAETIRETASSTARARWTPAAQETPVSPERSQADTEDRSSSTGSGSDSSRSWTRLSWKDPSASRSDADAASSSTSSGRRSSATATDEGDDSSLGSVHLADLAGVGAAVLGVVVAFLAMALLQVAGMAALGWSELPDLIGVVGFTIPATAGLAFGVALAATVEPDRRWPLAVVPVATLAPYGYLLYSAGSAGTGPTALATMGVYAVAVRFGVAQGAVGADGEDGATGLGRLALRWYALGTGLVVGNALNWYFFGTVPGAREAALATPLGLLPRAPTALLAVVAVGGVLAVAVRVVGDRVG